MLLRAPMLHVLLLPPNSSLTIPTAASLGLPPSPSGTPRSLAGPGGMSGVMGGGVEGGEGDAAVAALRAAVAMVLSGAYCEHLSPALVRVR